MENEIKEQTIRHKILVATGTIKQLIQNIRLNRKKQEAVFNIVSLHEGKRKIVKRDERISFDEAKIE